MSFPRFKGIALFTLCLVSGAVATGVAGAGSSGTKAKGEKGGAAARPASRAMLTAAGRGAVIPPRLSDIEQMCAMLLGCGDIPIQVPTYDFGLCVRHFWEQMASPDALTSSLTIRECGMGAVSCGQFARCALRGADANGCAGRGMGASEPVGRCDLSGRALQCLEGEVVGVRDCPRGGELCAVRGGKAACVSGRCDAEAGKKSKPTCSPDKTRITSCQLGRVVSLSCAALGLQCETIDGKPTCVPGSAPACSGSEATCDQSTAVQCVNGREVRVQCSQANLVCGVETKDKTRVGACASPDSGNDRKCNPKTFGTRCHGNSVEYCVGGKIEKYDCKTYFGLNKCVGRTGQAHCSK